MPKCSTSYTLGLTDSSFGLEQKRSSRIGRVSSARRCVGLNSCVDALRRDPFLSNAELFYFCSSDSAFLAMRNAEAAAVEREAAEKKAAAEKAAVEKKAAEDAAKAADAEAALALFDSWDPTAF